jgi:uracil-DNA glycosylase family 4
MNPPRLVPGNGNKKTATIAFVGEAPGAEEERHGIPFVGPTGKILRDRIIRPAGIPGGDLYFDNVCQSPRPTSWNASFPDLADYAVDLRRRLRELPNLRVIVPVGGKALQVLSLFESFENKKGKLCPLSIVNWRGSLKISRLTGHKMVPIIHPSFYLHNSKEHRYLHVTINDVARAWEETKSPSLSLPSRTHRIIYDTDEAISRLDYFAGRKKWCFDVEDFPNCIGFSEDPGISETIVFESPSFPAPHSASGIAEIRKRLAKCFTHDHQIVAQNGLYDMRDLEERHGINPLGWHLHSDTMYKHGLLYPELPHSLAFLCSIYTRTPFYKDEGRRFRPGRDPERIFFEYNGKDCCTTLESDIEMEAELDQMGMRDYYYNNLMPLVPILYRMFRKGVRVDLRILEDIRRELKRQEIISRIRLVRSINFDPNPRSPIENEGFLAAVRCPPSRIVRSEKTGKVKCDEDFLQRLKIDLGHSAISHYLDLRNFLYLRFNFTNLKLDPFDRYHAVFKLGPKSGRLASSGEHRGPQLQNIPEKGPVNIRRIFVPPPGRAFFHADLSQADARVFAYFAQIPGLIAIYESPDPDSHSRICSFLMNIPREQIVKGGLNDDKRQITKMACHAFDYGMRENRLVRQCRAAGIELNTATAMNWRSKYFERFPEIEPHWKWIQGELARSRSLTDLLGRKYLFLGSFDDDMYREAYSRVPQGTVGGILTLAMKRLQDSLDSRWDESDPRKPFIWNQVHDSLEIECDENDISALGPLVRDAFSIPLEAHGKSFQIPAEFAAAYSSRGGSWGKMESVHF